MSAPRIHLHIDRLVLRGVPASQRCDVVEALRAELHGQLASLGIGGDLGATRNVARVQGARPARVPDADASSLGRAFAGALVTGIKR